MSDIVRVGFVGLGDIGKPMATRLAAQQADAGLALSVFDLAAAPVDAYGAGTALVTGSGAPTAGLVYKLVEVEGRPVAKRSEDKAGRGGRKTALRSHKPSGTAVEEIVLTGPAPTPADGERLLQRPLLRGGEPVPGLPTLDESRELLRAAMVTLPWDGLELSRGEPAIPTVFTPR